MSAKTWHNWTFVRSWVRPNAVRLETDANLAGRGVTIAFLDAGFYPHPDLLMPTNRVVAYQDVTSDEEPFEATQPEWWNWHGTMTSVIACGSGYLSTGLYSGLARQSKAVLIKVSKRGRIRQRNVALGVRWAIENKDRYGIRILNISLGVGYSDRESRRTLLDYWVKKAVDAGLVVVTASGNSGGAVESPAKSPYALAVGGVFDHVNELYSHNHGITPDGVHKPDLLAPAALVASPILPGTPQQERAQALVELLAEPERVKQLWQKAQLPEAAKDYRGEELLSELQGQIAGHKVVSPYYEHADGTSVAAPLVSSIVAQMLEVDPTLKPYQVRAMLLSSARRLRGVSPFRQGAGVVCARSAVELAGCLDHPARNVSGLCPRQEDGKLHFLFHDQQARGVFLAGDFTDWQPNHPLDCQSGGLWSTAMATPPPGRYRYKFLVNGSSWVDDPWNAHKEPDHWGGLNSVVEIC